MRTKKASSIITDLLSRCSTIMGHSLAHAGPPYRAKTKGKVERPFRYVRQDFFLGRTFRSVEDLNVQFEAWRSSIANVRLHATTRQIVAEHFAQEVPSLTPLPAIPYSAVLTVERRISHEGMVSVGGNLYSVPDATRRRIVEVQNHPSEIRIFEDRVLVAVHPVLEGKNLRRVDPQHRKTVPASPIWEMPQPPPGEVAKRPLDFYGAVGERMARQGAPL
jgi:hypothetical protein